MENEEEAFLTLCQKSNVSPPRQSESDVSHEYSGTGALWDILGASVIYPQCSGRLWEDSEHESKEIEF